MAELATPVELLDRGIIRTCDLTAKAQLALQRINTAVFKDWPA